MIHHAARQEAWELAVEAYIPAEVTYQGSVIADAFVFTLYDANSSAPRGALTTRCPLPNGARGGPLIMKGTRGGRRWLVRLAEIEVVSKTALGCEFRIRGQIVRELLTDMASHPTG